MSPEFSITTRDLPDFHVMALPGELDIVSAYGLSLALLELAGSTIVVDLSGLIHGFQWHLSPGGGEESHPGRRTEAPCAYKDQEGSSWRSWGLVGGSWNGRRTGIDARNMTRVLAAAAQRLPRTSRGPTHRNILNGRADARPASSSGRNPDTSRPDVTQVARSPAWAALMDSGEPP